MGRLPRANLPHLKRIINQQVFLEESDPYIYDDVRKNQYAMEAAQQMMYAGGYSTNVPVDLANL